MPHHVKLESSKVSAGNAMPVKHSRFLADTFQPLLNIQGLRLILPQAPEDAQLSLCHTFFLHGRPWACRIHCRKTSRVNNFSRGFCLLMGSGSLTTRLAKAICAMLAGPFRLVAGCPTSGCLLARDGSEGDCPRGPTFKTCGKAQSSLSRYIFARSSRKVPAHRILIGGFAQARTSKALLGVAEEQLPKQSGCWLRSTRSLELPRCSPRRCHRSVWILWCTRSVPASILSRPVLAGAPTTALFCSLLSLREVGPLAAAVYGFCMFMTFGEISCFIFEEHIQAPSRQSHPMMNTVYTI